MFDDLSANVLGVLCGDLLGMTITLDQPARRRGCRDRPERGLRDLVPAAAQPAAGDAAEEPHLPARLLSHTREQRAKIVHCLEPLDPLTPREEEVLQLILDGNSNRQIAARLFVSENTVKTHIRNIFSKYGTRSRAELISTLLQDRNR